MENKKLYTKDTIRSIKERYDFKLSKSLGQNFLMDKNIIDKIVEGSNIGENDLVIEIGPGIGVLTRELALACKKVIAIEIDKKLIPILEETLGDLDNVQVINKDILKTDLKEIILNSGEFESVKVVGNLPYYITTPIIMKILEEEAPVTSITAMMQKEVAERIKEGPGKKAYGALSVAVQYYCTIDYLMTVPKEVFHPVPKVDSAVLRLDVRKEKEIKLDNSKVFWETIKKSFGQRRKTLLNALNGIWGLNKEKIEKILIEADIDPMRRGETLSMDEFGKLANRISKEEK